MCGRVIQRSKPLGLTLGLLAAQDPENLVAWTPRYNGAPGQQLLIIRENQATRCRSLEPLTWGLIPNWCRDEKGGRKPINARAETVHQLPSFRDAFQRRRAILPVDGFYEWRTIGGAKQPYVIGLASGEPFGIAGIWENWRQPSTGDWTRTFAVITVAANSLVGQIHDRMPAILPTDAFATWLAPAPAPRELLSPYPAERMRLWPVSDRVNAVRNDELSLLDQVPQRASETLFD